MFRHRNIHIFTWTSLRGKIHIRIDDILIDRKRYSNESRDRLFWGVDYDTDHYPVIAKVKKKVASK